MSSDFRAEVAATRRLVQAETALANAELDRLIKKKNKSVRPGPGGHREELLVQFYAKELFAALKKQVNPEQIAVTFVRMAGAKINTTINTPGGSGSQIGAARTNAAQARASAAIGSPRTLISQTATALAIGAAPGIGLSLAGNHVMSIFVGTIAVIEALVLVVILRMWADSWMAGAKDAWDSLKGGATPPSDDALRRAVESVKWKKWHPGSPPPASDIPGFADVKQQIGALIKGITEETRRQIQAIIEHYVTYKTDPVPWGDDDVENLTREIAAYLDDPSRAELIARTEVNRAMSNAAADLYKRSGIGWFDLVNHTGACPICVTVHDRNPHPLSDIASYSPQHPRCRCSMAPAKAPEGGASHASSS